MREIKLRVWDKDEHKFVYQERWELLNGIGDDCPCHRSSEFSHLVNYKGVQPELFIGRKDKNGKEICEGDIIECFYSANLRDEGLFTGEVIWDKERVKFKIVEIPPYKWGETEIAKEIICFEDAVEMEVIGNIHEHPNLLRKDSNNGRTGQDDQG